MDKPPSKREGASGRRRAVARSANRRSVSLASQEIVIIADDDETTRIVLQRALSLSGRVAIPVDDGGEIWPILERETVKALLLDLNMPGVNGWEVLRRLRDDPRFGPKRREMRVIVVSAQDDTASREFVLSLGADAFLPKPLDLNLLLSALKLPQLH